MMTTSWREKVAIVTGGSRGIGRHIALKLAESGMKVAVNYRGNQERAQETEQLIRERGAECLLIPSDVSDIPKAQSLIDAVLEHWGRIDVLVNNAGIARDTLLLRMKDEDWTDVIQTDLTSVFACTRAAIKPMMKQRFGRIVNIASIAGMLGNAGQANYAAAKAGVIGFTRSVAREMASRNITANVVAPGLIDTDLTQHMSQDAFQALVKQVPLGRAGRPEEVADAVWYLVQADYVTGQTLVIDGGLVMD
ncbi:3-oxoacyl-[acyl-carrier-protein] reductase [Sulfobacillus harzensis]|uniref:3-oxoacyl-[acyl-carrier-protein] reductase n=1 Tax=Sulfobacillus harzensis TaxID=2729629 RepID=A0A7Y0L4K5_9FIRM|nr:3-oxoacyl-[acyl-carrier-protein] reductase [Sulfobacillus harzensis]NMP22978.1 3-oxoacyl-[acyl-carrier-protein] reductase [Sulfobacillus harzensis]